jgi:hypothetical protein
MEMLVTIGALTPQSSGYLTPCVLEGSYQRFEGTHCTFSFLPWTRDSSTETLQVTYQIIRCHKTETVEAGIAVMLYHLHSEGGRLEPRTRHMPSWLKLLSVYQKNVWDSAHVGHQRFLPHSCIRVVSIVTGFIPAKTSDHICAAGAEVTLFQPRDSKRKGNHSSRLLWLKVFFLCSTRHILGSAPHCAGFPFT